MARLLNLLGYGSSVLATVCLILALVAAPIGVARADEPVVTIPPLPPVVDCSIGICAPQVIFGQCDSGSCLRAVPEAPCLCKPRVIDESVCDCVRFGS